MLYGHIERLDERVDHLRRLRELQDETGGFQVFIPLAFHPEHNMIGKAFPKPTGYDALRTLAVARLYLDNFPHVQASWFSEGKQAGQVALHFGADDWGGTLFEENVHKAADYVNTISVEEIAALIREAGFTPAQRTTEYEILQRY
jgi:aminodeoxyfutalosine synthase